MKGKFLNTKNVIIGLISCVLIGASVAGVTIFLKDNGEAEAAQATGTENTLPVTGNDEESNNQAGETNNQEENNENPVEENGENNEIDETEGENNTSNGNSSNTGTRPTEQEIVAGITETTVLEERKVFEDLKLSWTTIAIPAVTTNMGIYKPELKIEKTAIEVIKAEDGTTIEVDPENKPRVRVGDIIIFKIEVSNVGNFKATNVVVTDSLDVIFNNEKVTAGDALTTIETLDYGKKAILKVGYIATEDDINATEIVDGKEVEKDIYNIAYATDGKVTVQDDDDMPVNPDVTIEVNKIWRDENNQDGIRPEKIIVELLANGKSTGKTETIQADEQGNWVYRFTNLPKYDNNKEIKYTVKETAVEKYDEPLYEEGNDKIYIYNNYTPETVTVSGKKIWADADNQDGKRPTEIKITLSMEIDGIEIPEIFKNLFTKTITVKESDGWKWEFTNLPKNYDGKEITYKISEEKVEKYTTTYSQKEVDAETGNIILNVTNTYIPETTSISVSKKWEDANNQDGIRPPKITVNLLANGKKVQSQEITAANGWKGEFTDLPVYEKGKKITYTIEEKTVTGYTADIKETETNKYVITNTHKPEKVNVLGTKIWDDTENQYTKRPDEITINLLADGTKVQSKVVKKSDNWTYSFTNLDKFKNGTKIKYTVTEEPVTDYDVTYSNEKVEGKNITLDITNKYNQDITGNIITLEQTEQPLDVVFVLDISSSMLTIDEGNTKTRAQLMVEATNNAIKKLMESNSNNKVSIVLFNTNVKRLIPLAHYSTTGNYITYTTVTDDVNVGARINFIGGYSANVATSKYQEDNVAGCGAAQCGTYTQGGIKKATEILLENSNKDGRKPVMILLTDGNPTHYDEGTTYNATTGKADWQTKQPFGDSTSAFDKYGRERYITAEYYAYTMKTLENSKQILTNKYGTESEFYTVGINVAGSMAEALLNPTNANISVLADWDNVEISKDIHNSTDEGKPHEKYSVKIDGTTYQGAEYYKKQAARLNNLLTGSIAVTSNYVKTAYTQTTANNISTNFNAIVNSIIKTTTTTITAESYGKDRKIELSGFNEANNSEFSLKVTKVGVTTPLIDTTTISDAMEKGYITKNAETGKYYLDLSATTGKVGVTLKYHK